MVTAHMGTCWGPVWLVSDALSAMHMQCSVLWLKKGEETTAGFTKQACRLGALPAGACNRLCSYGARLTFGGRKGGNACCPGDCLMGGWVSLVGVAMSAAFGGGCPGGSPSSILWSGFNSGSLDKHATL